jgi:SAM-dependent methyltransferase
MAEAAPELDGYRYDVEYRHDYYREISPAHLRLLAQSCGIAFPEPATRPLRYLELGYGNGVTLCVNAAASPGEYWGTDISPLHVRAADSLARAAGVPIEILNLSFADLLRQGDLPQFDVIAAHGVWSWVSAENRAVIVELLRTRLAEGGLFFVSVLAIPNASLITPLQRLMRIQNPSNPGDSLKLLHDFQSLGSPYFAPGGHAASVLGRLGKASSNYLSHEFLNQNWEPFLFSETARTLAPAGLQFLAAMGLRDQIDDVNFTPGQCAMLASIDDAALRETARDFLRMRRQRYDVFVKGGQPGPGIARDQAFVAMIPPHLASDENRAVLERLAADGYRPKALPDVPREQLYDLVDAMLVQPVQPAAATQQARAACTRLNDEILRRSRDGDTIRVLASPVTGTGIPVSRAERLFLLAMRDGAATPQHWVTFARQAMPDSPPRDLMMSALAMRLRLPCLQALGVA